MASHSVAKAVVFDIRNVRERDSLFLWASQALYETSLLAYASQSSCFSSLSIAIVGTKGFEILAGVLPVSVLDFSFQKIITKLKQQLKIPPMSAIYPHRGSFSYLLSEMLSQFQDREINELHFTICTRSEREKLTDEINAFLEKSNFSLLLNVNLKVEVVQLSCFTLSSVETSTQERLTWRTVTQEPEIFDYFKDWLKIKRQNWRLEAANNEDWSVIVDLQDIAIDLSRWQTPQASNTNMTTVSLFSSSEASCLQLTDYIRSDALPAFYLFGAGREVTVSKASVETNQAKFSAFVDHLRRESWLAIARLILKK